MLRVFSVASCGVCVSRLVRFARVSGRVSGFDARNGVFAAGLLRQGCGCHKLRGAFSGFCRRHFDMVSKYNVGLRALLLWGLSEPEFCGDLVYGFREVVGKNDFPYHFKGVIVRYGGGGLVVAWLLCDGRRAWLLAQSGLAALLASLVARDGSGFGLGGGAVLGFALE